MWKEKERNRRIGWSSNWREKHWSSMVGRKFGCRWGSLGCRRKMLAPSGRFCASRISTPRKSIKFPVHTSFLCTVFLTNMFAMRIINPNHICLTSTFIMDCYGSLSALLHLLFYYKSTIAPMEALFIVRNIFSQPKCKKLSIYPNKHHRWMFHSLPMAGIHSKWAFISTPINFWMRKLCPVINSSTLKKI